MHESLPPPKDAGSVAFAAAALIAGMVVAIFVGFNSDRSDMQRELQALHVESRSAPDGARPVEHR